jgi:hypothetical protein
MAITFKWSVTKITVIPFVNNQTNVVISVEWLCQGTDDVNKLTASASGIQQLGAPANPFTDYSNLTESQVLAWCYEPVTTTSTSPIDNTIITSTTNLQPDTETQVTGQLTRQLALISATPALPWIKT